LKLNYYIFRSPNKLALDISGDFTIDEFDLNITNQNLDEDDEKLITYEGYLYKVSSKKNKKYWFKLINKDLYCKL